jgi:uncharacterized protein (DUF302 family)
MKSLLLGMIMAIASTQTWAGDAGLVTTKSKFGFAETQQRLEAAIKAKGLTLFAKVDHGDNAAKAELKMNPAIVTLFGGAKGGTPFMLAAATAGIDLPMKALVWEDASKQVFVSYNSLDYLKARHNISGLDELSGKLNGLLAAIAKAATE